MKKIFSIYFILISTVTLSQNIQIKNSNEIDSLRIEQKYHMMLNGDINKNLPLFSLGEVEDPYAMVFESEFLNYALSTSELNTVGLNRIKNDMAQTFAVYRLGQNKYHLGIVSDILGYASTAAAAGLAIYHVTKYKKYYGIK